MAIQHMRAFGVPIDTDPMNALMGEVRRSAGIVAWLEVKVSALPEQLVNADGELNEESMVQITKQGMKPGVWLQLYNDERAHLARVCKMALDAGVSQSLVDMLKQQSQAWIAVFREVFADPRLQLTPAQQELWPVITDEHLDALLRGPEKEPTT